MFCVKNIKEELFNLKSELNNGIYLSILLIIILSNIFSKEYKSGAIILIQGSKERKKLFLYKFIISYILVLHYSIGLNNKKILNYNLTFHIYYHRDMSI